MASWFAMAYEEGRRAGQLEYVYRIREVVKVTDGDTYWLRVDTGFRNNLLVNIRLQGFDTPEKNKGSAREKECANHARELADNFLWLGRTDMKYWIRTEKDPDNFGRWLGDIWIERPDGSTLHLGDWLREHKLASCVAHALERTSSTRERARRVRDESYRSGNYHPQDEVVPCSDEQELTLSREEVEAVIMAFKEFGVKMKEMKDGRA